MINILGSNLKNIILLLILTFTLTACGSSSNEESSETKDNQSTVDVNTSGELQQSLEPKPTVAPMPQEFESKLSTPTSTPTSTPISIPISIPTSTPTVISNPIPNPITTPTITILNYSDYPTNDIKKWVTLAESKMQSRKSNIFSFIYPVGNRKNPEQLIRSDYADRIFSQHDRLLTTSQIESILGEVEKWLKEEPCVKGDNRALNQHISDYRAWLEQGGDASTMHTVCATSRVVAMGITQQMRENETLQDFQNLLLHEFYHAFQQDLAMEGECGNRRDQDEENSNTIWFVEGGAHYFSTTLVSEINNNSNPNSDILKIASENYSRDSSAIGPDKWGAAALRLMVELNLLTEESILDGSLFHNCARELEFDKQSSDIQGIKSSWFLIENKNGIYQFKK